MPGGPGLVRATAAAEPSGGIDWNPVSWAKSAWDDITGTVNPIYKWVIKQVAKAIGLVENDIGKVRGYLLGVIHAVGSGVGDLAHDLEKVEQTIGGDIRGDIASALSGAKGLVKDALGPLESTVSQLHKDVENWIGNAEHAADKALNWFYDHTIRPALHDIEHEFDVVHHDIDTAVRDVERYWIDPLKHDVEEALHDAKKAVYFIDHSALDAIHLIDQCWDWLEWLAHNPAGAIESLPKDFLASLTRTGLES